jgi:hypothetical protein
LIQERPPGAVVRTWCPKRSEEDVLGKGSGSGMTWGDRRRNARRERLRELLPRRAALPSPGSQRARLLPCLVRR